MRPYLVIVAFLAFVAVPATSAAASLTEQLSQLGLVVSNADAFEESDLEAFAEGARAIPRPVRDAVGPIRLRRVSSPCLFGMGRYSESCPTWGERGAFLIYDVPPLQGEGPVWRLAPLKRAERVATQRQRAIVHAFFARWDEQARWSDDQPWRSINGWSLKTDPQNVYRWGYSRFLGQRSPRLDLLTFAEEFFVRPEAVVASERRDALDPNLGVGCQEFTKSRFLRKKLVDLAPAWREDERWFSDCPEFENWARTADVEGIDILIAAATADRPESLYGHLLLHVRYRGSSDGFEPVYQFGAVTDSNVGFIEYFTRGLLGGFYSAIEIADFRAIDRRILQYEQRTLRHYKLNLDRRQILQVQQRLWEAERRVRYPYFFLDDNCASFLEDLLEPALDMKISGRASFIVTPTDVLDTLAAMSNEGRGRLLVKTSEVHYSSRARAQAAVSKRRRAARRFADAVGGADEVLDLAARLDEATTEQRARLYPELARAFSERIVAGDAAVVGADDSPHRLALDYFLYSSQVERFVVEVEAGKTRALRLRTVKVPVMTAEEIFNRRETLFRFENLQRRADIVTKWSREAEALLAQQPREEWSDAALAQHEVEQRAQATYGVAIDGMSAMIDRFEPDLDAVGYLDRKEARFREAEAARDARAVGPSGKHRFLLAAGTQATDAVEAVGVGRIKYAFIAEYLGEQRSRGLRPDIESQVFDLQLDVPFTGDALTNIDAELTLFGFKTIEQPLDPVRDAWDDVFGWGFDGVIAHDGTREVWTELALGGGYIWPAWKADYASSHLVFGVYPEARSLFVTAGVQGHLAARVFARFRLHTYGSYANAIGLELVSGNAFQFPLWDWAWRNEARLSWDIALGSSSDPVVMRPFVEAEYTNETYRPGEEGEAFWRGRAGLELEL